VFAQLLRLSGNLDRDERVDLVLAALARRHRLPPENECSRFRKPASSTIRVTGPIRVRGARVLRLKGVRARPTRAALRVFSRKVAARWESSTVWDGSSRAT